MWGSNYKSLKENPPGDCLGRDLCVHQTRPKKFSCEEVESPKWAQQQHWAKASSLPFPGTLPHSQAGGDSGSSCPGTPVTPSTQGTPVRASSSLWRHRSQPRWNTSATSLSLSCALSPWVVRSSGITACVSWTETLFPSFNYQNYISVWLASPLLHYLFEPASSLFDLVSPPFLLGLAKSCAVILCLALLSVTS